MRTSTQVFGLLALILVSVTSALAGSLTLAWDPVTDSRVAGYKIHYGTSSRNYTSHIDVGNVTTRTVPNLTDGVRYYLAVTAYDGSRIESGFSNEVAGTVPAGAPVASFTASTTTGTAPLAMNFTSTSTGTINTYTWAFGDGTSSNSQNPSKLYSNAGVYSVSLTVTGPSGANTNVKSNYITVTSATDTTPPTAPQSLAATANGNTGINLSWAASTDNVGVTGYRIERCQGTSCTNFVQIATRTGTTFGDSGLAAGTSYRYRVRSTDAAGKLSAYSAVAMAMTVAPLSATNFALASNGGAASASSTASASFSVTGINNGERAGAGWGTGSGGWNDATASTWPDWVQITFKGSKSIDRVVVYTLQDSYGSPVEPTDTMTFTQYGVRDFRVQGWTGSSWVTLATVTGNNLVKRTVTFTAFTTDRVRVAVSAALWGHSRITEIEAWGR